MREFASMAEQRRVQFNCKHEQTEFIGNTEFCKKCNKRLTVDPFDRQHDTLEEHKGER